MFWQVLITIGLAYLIAKTLNAHHEKQNEELRVRIEVIEDKRIEEREKYHERVALLNDALDQFRK